MAKKLKGRTEVVVNPPTTGLEPRVAFRSNCEIAIHVPDLAQAEAFYAGVLGFRLVGKLANQLEFDTGVLRLYINEDPEDRRPYIPSLDVPDYAAARRHLEAAGCMLVSAGAHSGAVYFQDLFGFVFDIIERPSKDALLQWDAAWAERGATTERGRHSGMPG
jgi:catechol 2,3-dioxygenase-like lactoylglutathione lyase family enzyme